MIKRFLSTFILLLGISNSLNAQSLLSAKDFRSENRTSYFVPKRELRGIWIATISNIDFPSKKGLTAHEQKAEFIRRLDFLQEIGINTVIVQVRPAADCLCQSSYEPWSRFLTGKQGSPPNPHYDPLEFMIEEAHKRNMDFHAWFNPFRALIDSNNNPNPAHHVTKTHPHWFIKYQGKTYFDPGNEEAKEYITKVILEIVEKYDIDAVHIDDYFYPYPTKGVRFNDDVSYLKHGRKTELGDWRRENVNGFVSNLASEIKKKKSWIKFGVSPFGIWRNIKQDPNGSLTKGLSSYDEIYADSKKWFTENWVDYIAPQLYWERGHNAADYTELTNWWSKNKSKSELYLGLGLYKLAERKSAAWQSNSEILSQVTDARNSNATGIIFYSLSSFDKIERSIQDSLKTEKYFGNISIPPAMPWIDAKLPDAPNVSVQRHQNKITLEWTTNEKTDKPLKFLVYRFEEDEKIDLENSKYIRTLTRDHSFTEMIEDNKSYVYVVTALNRLWNESEPNIVVVEQQK